MFVLYHLLLAILPVVFLLYYYFSQKLNYWKIRNIPGPKPTLLFGNIKDTTLRKENWIETLVKIYNDYPDEPVVGLYRMTSPCLLIRDLDIIKNVMIRDFQIFEDRGVEFSKEGLGANLFHADGETWRVLRNKFSPLFSSGKLKAMQYLIVEQSDIFMKNFEKIVQNQPELDIYTHIKHYTISSIMSCAFGLQVDTVNEPAMTVFKKIDTLTLKTNILQEIDMMFPGLFKNFSYSLFPAEVHHFFENLVADVIKQRNGKATNRNDFMDLILEIKEQGNVITRRDIKDSEDASKTVKLTQGMIAAQAFAFYIAGHETSSTVLSFMLYELAKNPKIQDKIIEEVDSVLEKYNGNLTYEALNDCTYLESAFHEANRKYPIVPLQRKANQGYKVPGTEITIEKDTVVVMSPYGVHYDKKYFPDPEKFDPNRFSVENIQNRHPCAYLSFGVGPRNCIGLRFGKLQSRIMAVKLFSKYRVEPSPKTSKIHIDPERVLMSPLGGINLKFVPRN